MQLPFVSEKDLSGKILTFMIVLYIFIGIMVGGFIEALGGDLGWWKPPPDPEPRSLNDDEWAWYENPESIH